MAVFVRVFRLVMLFFNVYDSYKVLKLPPPSAQNKGKPSLRALSQRKRDMKGCLAVWIVWSCFITYERFAEAVASLFIPFYDEVKSLILLFLIMTRARGAEPIYLHIIRPFLKPYTSTIDQLLDFAHVVGDVIFGLVALPFIYAIEWWQRKFGTDPEALDTETESSSSPISPTATSNSRIPIDRTNPSNHVRGPEPSAIKQRQPTTKQSSLLSADRKKGQISDFRASHDRNADKLSTRHDMPTTDATKIDGLPHVDEWRQYPAFPSAYPPTPLVKHTQITAVSIVPTSTTLHPNIPEEPARQDFHQSLLLPHNASNPRCVGDGSDQIDLDGVQSHEITIAVMDVDENDASEELVEKETEYESEDEFNITLRTPDAPLRILTSLGPPTFSNEISPLSLPSRSSALATADEESPLFTPSSEYTTSDGSVLAPTHTGQRRTGHSIPSTVGPRIQNSRLTARGTSVRMSRSARSPTKRAIATQRRPLRNITSRPLGKLGSLDHENEAPGSIACSPDDEELASKRRRVSSSPPPDPMQVIEPARRRVVRPAVTTTTKPRIVSTQKPSTLRTSPRPRTKTNAKPTTLSSREGSTA